MPQGPKIIFEVEETILVKMGAKTMVDFCPICGSHVEMVSAEILAALAECAEREIFRAIEAGRIHFVEQARTLVCLNCYRREKAAEHKVADETLPEIAGKQNR